MIIEGMEDSRSTVNSDEVLVAAEIFRSVRITPPAHYTLTIESFSRLSELIKKTGVDNYESGDIEAGGYKWKLFLYPQGNEKRNGRGYISLYLAIANESRIPTGCCLNVNLKMFVYNQIEDNYLVVQDGLERRYHSLKTEHGFHQLLPLATFNDPSNGYLVDDCCAFGVEVDVIKGSGKGEKISIMKQPNVGNYQWRIEGFSYSSSCLYSERFTAGQRKWYLQLYPKGDSRVRKGESLSLFLCLVDDGNLLQGDKVYVEYMLSVKSQTPENHYEREGAALFCRSELSGGLSPFMSLSHLFNASNKFLVKDTLVVEARVTLAFVVRGLI